MYTHMLVFLIKGISLKLLQSRHMNIFYLLET